MRRRRIRSPSSRLSPLIPISSRPPTLLRLSPSPAAAVTGARPVRLPTRRTARSLSSRRVTSLNSPILSSRITIRPISTPCRIPARSPARIKLSPRSKIRPPLRLSSRALHTLSPAIHRARLGLPTRQYPGQNRPYVAPNLSSTPITIRPGSLFSVRISEPLDSHKLRGGENFHATLAQDIFEGQYLVIPRGAVVQGYVVGVKKPGAVRGEAGFALQMTSLTLGGQNYPITTDTFASDTHGKGGYTTANTIGAAAIGALIGAVAGGGPGAAIGAVAGGAAGVGLSAASGPREVMPPETLLNFHLKEPLTISPISLSEVQQLQASATPRPVSRPRPPYPYPYYYGYPPPPPPPPPGYYYPYRY